MELKDVLKLDCTKSAVLCSSKKRALELISELAAEQLDQNPQKLFECMLSREKMGSTGIGSGIAIPHGRIFNSDQAVGVLSNAQSRLSLMPLITSPSICSLPFWCRTINVKNTSKPCL